MLHPQEEQRNMIQNRVDTVTAAKHAIERTRKVGRLVDDSSCGIYKGIIVNFNAKFSH